MILIFFWKLIPQIYNFLGKKLTPFHKERAASQWTGRCPLSVQRHRLRDAHIYSMHKKYTFALLSEDTGVPEPCLRLLQLISRASRLLISELQFDLTVCTSEMSSMYSWSRFERNANNLSHSDKNFEKLLKSRHQIRRITIHRTYIKLQMSQWASPERASSRRDELRNAIE